MQRIPLRLDPDSGGDRNGAGGADAPHATMQPEKKPLMGWAAVGFGLLGVFGSFMFVPIGFVCSILALFMGQAIWGFFGLMITVVGVLSSPVILGLIGLGTFAFVLDWQAFLQPVLDLLNSLGFGGDGNGRDSVGV